MWAHGEGIYIEGLSAVLGQYAERTAARLCRWHKRLPADPGPAHIRCTLHGSCLGNLVPVRETQHPPTLNQ